MDVTLSGTIMTATVDLSDTTVRRSAGKWRGRTDKTPVLFATCLFLLACVAAAYAYLDCQTHGPPIRSDGYGYYAYLPSVFLDHDLSMKTPKAFRWTVVGNRPLPYDWDGIAVYTPTGKYLDKYTVGTAVLESPFFGVAFISAKLLGLPASGYSLPFQIAIQLSGMVYAAAGAYFLFRYLSARFDRTTTFLSVTAAVLATNVFHYATYHSAHSHAFSFFLFAVLIAGAERYRTAGPGQNIRSAAYTGVILGLIALVRVTNATAVILPLVFACERFNRFTTGRQLLLEIGCGALSFGLVFSPQLMYWYAITGHIFVNSYQAEGFNWLEPQIVPFLFSLRRGLFVWTPIVLVAVAGLPRTLRRDRALALALSLILAAEIYICSSWWCWWFGASFGSRPMADMMPLLAVPLAYSLEWLGRRYNPAIPQAVIWSSVLINLFLMFSLWNFYLPWDNVELADFAQLPDKWGSARPVAELHRILLPPYVLGTAFEADRAPPFSIITEGWQDIPAPAIWSVKKQVLIYFRPVFPESGDLCLDMQLAGTGALLTANHPLQRAIVHVNGALVGVLRFVLNGHNTHRTVPIARRFLHNWRVAEIRLDLPDAAAPAALGVNRDARVLSLHLSRMAIGLWQPRPHTCAR